MRGQYHADTAMGLAVYYVRNLFCHREFVAHWEVGKWPIVTGTDALMATWRFDKV
jgi:hypothetical protein